MGGSHIAMLSFVSIRCINENRIGTKPSESYLSKPTRAVDATYSRQKDIYIYIYHCVPRIFIRSRC